MSTWQSIRVRISVLGVLRNSMDDVERVFAEIKARPLTAEEISERLGVNIRTVEKILCLLVDFDFAVKEGRKYRAAKEWAALRLGPGKELL